MTTLIAPDFGGRAEPAPASYAQEAFWLSERFVRRSERQERCTVWSAHTVRGRLDVRRLEDAVSGVLVRHDSLRATRRDVDGRPVLHVHPPTRVPLVVHDLRRLSAAPALIPRFVCEEVLRPFDLVRGPLFRASVAQLEDEFAVIVLGMHHSAADGWSLNVLHDDLAALYDASDGSLLSPAPSHAQLVRAERAAFEAARRGRADPSSRFSRTLRYWREVVRGTRPCRIPTDRPIDGVGVGCVGRTAVRLDSHDASALVRTCAQLGVTPYMAALAAFGALVRPFQGSEVTVVGMVANRADPKTTRTIGFFADPVLFRLPLPRHESFSAAARMARSAVLVSLEHPLPFVKFLERFPDAAARLTIDEQPSVVFQFEPARKPLSLTGLDVTPIEGRFTDGLSVLAPPTFSMPVDLNVTVLQRADGIELEAYFNLALWDRSSIKTLLESLLAVLRAAAEDPESACEALVVNASAHR